MRLSLLALAHAAMLLAAGCNSTGSKAGAGGPPASAWIEKPAPEFKLMDPDGKEVSLSSFRGKPVLLNFWGIDCPHCAREIPSLVRIDQLYRESGLVILGVNVRDTQGPEQVKEFARNTGIRYPLLLEGNKTAIRYGVEELPTNFYIDAAGKVAAMAVGFEGQEKLQRPLMLILPSR
jgi:peroxiredoxin